MTFILTLTQKKTVKYNRKNSFFFVFFLEIIELIHIYFDHKKYVKIYVKEFNDKILFICCVVLILANFYCFDSGDDHHFICTFPPKFQVLAALQ